MKKYLSFIIVAIVVVTLIGCNKGISNSKIESGSKNVEKIIIILDMLSHLIKN